MRFTDLSQMTQDLVLEVKWGLYVLRSQRCHQKGGKDAGQTQTNSALCCTVTLYTLKAEISAY